MKPWLRIASTAAALWIFGCAVWALVEYLRVGSLHTMTSDTPASALFFRSSRVGTISIRHPALGEVAFPDTMTRAEIEQAVRHNLPPTAENPNAPIEWNVPESKPPTHYYQVSFAVAAFLRWSVLPALAIWLGFALLVSTGRWTFRGFRDTNNDSPVA